MPHGYRILTLATLIGLASAALCAGTAAQGEACVIMSPRDGSILSGMVEVVGATTHPQFWKYELAVATEGSDGWAVLAVREQQVVEGRLALWDTSAFANGTWQLRLRTVVRSGNYLEWFVRGLIIANGTPTSRATPTATPTPTASPTETASPGPLPTVAVVVKVPTVPPAASPTPAAQPGTAPRYSLPSAPSLAQLGRAVVGGGLAAALLFLLWGIFVGSRKLWGRLLQIDLRAGRKGPQAWHGR